MMINKRFLTTFLSIMMAICFAVCENANAAAARTSARGAPAARKSVTAAKTTKAPVVETATETVEETAIESEPEFVVVNKSSEFDAAISTVLESASADNSFAEQIRKQRAALNAADATSSVNKAQQNAIKNNSNTCDRDLRKCMAEKCGNDFMKCATDGDTIFGDKLNVCKTKTTCKASEFNSFANEIKADLEMNVRLASYNNVINCGNQYNACIVNQCGTTYGKCLGKANADAAIQKCATIAKDCTEADNGLTNRFGTAIAKLRENAETEVKRDEERMYALRDLMRSACEKLGAMFDERTFDCLYTVNFFVGDNQTTPSASRKRYAGDTFVCMQEWFGVNVTTAQENAARETRAQTGASSAMLGSGVGTAVGLISSGAMGRALETQKAKKEMKKAEKETQEEENAEKDVEKGKAKAEKESKNSEKENKKGDKSKKSSKTGGGKVTGNYTYFKPPADPDKAKHEVCKNVNTFNSGSTFLSGYKQCEDIYDKSGCANVSTFSQETVNGKDVCVGANAKECERCIPINQERAKCRKEGAAWCKEMGMIE